MNPSTPANAVTCIPSGVGVSSKFPEIGSPLILTLPFFASEKLPASDRFRSPS